MLAALTLSDLLSRRLHLQWYEGIAIVRGVAARLLEHQGAGMRIPELHQIVLLGDGYVTLNGGATASEPVRRLGQLTQAVLTDANVPVQLRLIVSQATAPIPSYPSLVEFDQALGYFERPDHAGILKALFERAEAAGPTTAGDAPTLDRIAPLSETNPAAPPALRHRKHLRRLIATVAILVGVAALSGAAVLYVRTSGTTVNGREVARATEVAADAVGAAVLAGVSAVSDRVGLGRIVPKNAVDASAAPPADVPSAHSRRMTSDRSAAARVERAKADDDASRHTIAYYEISPSTLKQILGLTDIPEHPSDASIDSVIDAPDAPIDWVIYGPDSPIDSVIYAPGADGVLPPIGLRPQLPRELPPSVDPASLSRIELIIARDGSVESAKLLGNRRDVQGGMFLSAAKAWQFQPATKDGVAVRFRKMILVSFE
jgi:hypothetical protein